MILSEDAQKGLLVQNWYVRGNNWHIDVKAETSLHYVIPLHIDLPLATPGSAPQADLHFLQKLHLSKISTILCIDLSFSSAYTLVKAKMPQYISSEHLDSLSIQTISSTNHQLTHIFRCVTPPLSHRASSVSGIPFFTY